VRNVAFASDKDKDFAGGSEAAVAAVAEVAALAKLDSPMGTDREFVYTAEG
tara:strand:- start:234 stop:386 length:153 start_codon:yes stop_codon:yes gene_type:complete